METDGQDLEPDVTTRPLRWTVLELPPYLWTSLLGLSYLGLVLLKLEVKSISNDFPHQPNETKPEISCKKPTLERSHGFNILLGSIAAFVQGMQMNSNDFYPNLLSVLMPFWKKRLTLSRLVKLLLHFMYYWLTNIKKYIIFCTHVKMLNDFYFCIFYASQVTFSLVHIFIHLFLFYYVSFFTSFYICAYFFHVLSWSLLLSV